MLGMEVRTLMNVSVSWTARFLFTWQEKKKEEEALEVAKANTEKDS